MTQREWDRPVSVAMLALGGQGGGVLTKWLVDVAEDQGFLAQSTFVAGVAQRTGATVYCVEMFPIEKVPDNRDVIFTTYPIPGDVDLVVAGESAEAGRAIQKGFVTPDATTLVASSHRVYSIDEKVALGDGIVDQQPVMAAAREAAREFVCFDMAKAADETGSVISAVMLGAIAASGALPFERAAFEDAIRRGGRAVDANLRGFAAGYDLALSPPVENENSQDGGPVAQGPVGKALLDRVASELPRPVQEHAAHGVLRALEYQDRVYAGVYLERLAAIVEADRDNGGEQRDFGVSTEVARLLALQMCYEDTMRVAELKTAKSRFARIREHLGTPAGQLAYVTEYFHPRFEEFCDSLPASLGKQLVESARARRWLAPMFRKGRLVATNKLGGFLMLSILARCKRWRRGTHRYAMQSMMIGDWLKSVRVALGDDYDAALAIAACIEIVRGYGDTWERGNARYQAIIEAANEATVEKKAAITRRLHSAALADEDGTQFDERLRELRAA